MNRILCLLFACTYFLPASAQYYNQQAQFLNANRVWAFGDSAGVRFTNGNPQSIQTAIQTFEGCATVSDPVTGQLLFYSDGWKCWNRNHAVMPDGFSLLGAGSAGTTSQAACIVPVIDTPGKYYLFSLNAQGANPGLYYSIVDMSLDNGLGNIVSGEKNILLDGGSLSEAMIAIPGNNCDLWLMIHAKNETIFKAYHITRFGLDTNPVLSNTGTQIQGASAYFQGGMTISPDRTMLALTSLNGLAPALQAQGLLLCKFDAGSGQVSDALLLDNGPHYSACFSPDNSRLYAGHGFLNQYDVSNFITSGTVGAPVFIANAVRSPKLYRDTIYCIGGAAGAYLSRINKPNLAGTACNFQPAVISLLPGTHANWGLPNEVVYPLAPDTIGQKVLDTLICISDQPEFEITLTAPTGYTQYTWNDGLADQDRSVTQPGTYWVICKDPCHSRTDTFVIKTVNVQFSFGADTIICSAPPFRLSATINDAAFLWQDGSANSFYTVTDDGSYWLEINKAGCVSSDTIDIRFKNTSQNLGSDQTFCKDKPLSVALHATKSEGAFYQWSTGSTEPDITVQEAGLYWVSVNNAPCQGSDTIRINTELCDCFILMPTAFSPNGDGINDDFRPMVEPGCIIKGYTLYIYNRWGQMIYNNKSGNISSEGWDGTVKGVPADAGTYMYYLQLEAGTKNNVKQLKGDVVLIR
jgi:gliding motility-associated-like protein